MSSLRSARNFPPRFQTIFVVILDRGGLKFGRQSRDHSLLGTIWIGAISGGLLLGRRVGTTDRPFAGETIVRSLTHLRVEKVRKEVVRENDPREGRKICGTQDLMTARSPGRFHFPVPTTSTYPSLPLVPPPRMFLPPSDHLIIFHGSAVRNSLSYLNSNVQGSERTWKKESHPHVRTKVYKKRGNRKQFARNVGGF